jgi:hypothetical protein
LKYDWVLYFVFNALFPFHEIVQCYSHKHILINHCRYKTWTAHISRF